MDRRIAHISIGFFMKPISDLGKNRIGGNILFTRPHGLYLEQLFCYQEDKPKQQHDDGHQNETAHNGVGIRSRLRVGSFEK